MTKRLGLVAFVVSACSNNNAHQCYFDIDCKSDERCGNGIVDAARGEQCDDSNTIDGDGCQHDCKLPRCGDGVRDPSLAEECDAGPANSLAPDALCRPNCQLPRCGDHVVDPSLGDDN